MNCIGISYERVDLFGECAAPVDTTFASVDGGDGFSIGVDACGAVIGWGSGFYGELGDQSTDERDTAEQQQQQSAPATQVRVPARIAAPEPCVQVSCGASHVLVVARNGGVFAWGWNRHHQVSPSAADVLPRASPVVFDAAAAVQVRAVAAGGMHSLALDSVGRVWSWGDNTHGQLGVGSEGGSGDSPAELQLPRKAASIAAGWAHSALLTDAQELLTFGFGLYHQLGHGATQSLSTPLAVDALSGLDVSCGGPVIQVACGSWHTAARTASGDVYTWGWGRDGQLGHGRSMEPLPRVVDFTAGRPDPDDPRHQVVDVACGPRQTLVLCAGGALLWWGRQPPEPRAEACRELGTCRRVALGHAHALVLVERQGEQS